MIKIFNKDIKTKRGLNINFRNKFINHTDIQGNYKYLYDWYKIDKNINQNILLEIINLINNGYIEREIINYANKSKNNFSIGNYEKYLEYRKINKSDSNSDKYYKLVYGSSWKEEKENTLFQKNNVYDPIYISKRENISIKDAEVYIDKYKSDKATSLDNFIKNHGEKIGKEKFKKFQETSKHNLDKYIKLYGKIEGNLKWKEYFNKKSETSAFRKEFWISKGLNEDDAKEKVRFISDNSSLEYFRRICNSEEEALESYGRRSSETWFGTSNSRVF